MTHRLASICAAIVATACFSHAASAVTLYAPTAGTPPSSQGWFTSGTGGTATASVAGGSYNVDTTADSGISYGSALRTTLDTAAGFNLVIAMQVLAETHLTPDRAGFSVIVVGNDLFQSLEIAFWTDRVWVYAFDQSTLTFSHGAEAMFDTSTAAHSYSLAVQNNQYTLSADGTSLLAGSMANYNAAGSIYAMPNTLFFGDDTSRAASDVALQVVSLNPVPEPATAGLFLLGGALLAVRKRRPRG